MGCGLKIRRAEKKDADKILAVTKAAFMLYSSELPSQQPVAALNESADDVIRDIEKHVVYVAEEDGRLVGAIRLKKLTGELAYVYRFGVSPLIGNTGVGSGLLAKVIDECTQEGFKAVALHTNSRYYKLARYYYGKQFFVHSTCFDKGYIRALFVKELKPDEKYDLSEAMKL
ncbi:MAG: GNAT family N-acetyltransferase [Clostridia bacterium]|nr:GNAT family N-acetyltransferase [Clostridia bacterium]